MPAVCSDRMAPRGARGDQAGFVGVHDELAAGERDRLCARRLAGPERIGAVRVVRDDGKGGGDG